MTRCHQIPRRRGWLKGLSRLVPPLLATAKRQVIHAIRIWQLGANVDERVHHHVSGQRVVSEIGKVVQLIWYTRAGNDDTNQTTRSRPSHFLNVFRSLYSCRMIKGQQ